MLDAMNMTPLGHTDVDIAGDLEYYGYVDQANLPGGATLADMVGYTQGSNINTTAPWFHFGLHGKHLYIASKPFRNNVTWGAMDAVGIAQGQTTIQVGDSELAVRLIRGGASSGVIAGTEWNQLIYRVYTGISVTPKWLNLTAAQLVVDGSLPGQATLCYESTLNGSTRSVTVRGTGGTGVTLFQSLTDSATQYRGWRPCLELVKGPAIT